MKFEIDTSSFRVTKQAGTQYIIVETPDNYSSLELTGGNYKDVAKMLRWMALYIEAGV